jgi:predicted phage terminase large subunit-like protein
LRKRLEYPALKRAVREQQRLFNANLVLIEDKASGTQLIQELIADGFHRVTRYKPDCDKIMRLHAQTALIESGFVYIPQTAHWLAEYLHEMTVFPKGKHDDQVDSTAQFLDWFKKPMPSWGIFEFYRMEYEKLHPPTATSETWVRLRAPPPGIGAIQTALNRHYNVRPDGAFEMLADDAEILISQGWTKIAE